MAVVNIAVAEPLRRRGVATRMVGFAQERAAELGMRRLKVGTGSTSFEALALYQRCGMRMTRIDRDYFLRSYPGPTHEHGIRVRDMARLSCPIPVDGNRAEW
ncbi:GNAT family N-acetyltransferase [Bifidobacterium xylocopae]|uniref:GNAT family N-acetyltransferase n=1 Tax=Bifidobacterium xylocopae TaxID=2493119 RepID=UPI001374F756|nr:GNAT family N-acetyltransferase [Bifidobacterium xylocopae]